MLERLLEQLTDEMGLPTPPENEAKMRTLPIGGLAISIRQLETGVYFFAKISAPPATKKEELLTELMKANFLGQGTGGACIGLSEDESSLTLSHALPYEMNYKTFKEALEDFANFLDYWKKETAKFA